MNFDEAVQVAMRTLPDDAMNIRESYRELMHQQKFLKTMIASAFIKQGFRFPPEVGNIEIAYVDDFSPAMTIEYDDCDKMIYQAFTLDKATLHAMLVPVVRHYMETGCLTRISQIIIGKELGQAVIRGRLPQKQFSMGSLFDWNCTYVPTISGIVIL